MTQALISYFSGLLKLSWTNFFWWFIAISLFFWILEIIVPWRKNQSVFRKDFGLDAFYMFFNMYIFPILGFNILITFVNTHFIGLLSNIGINKIDIINIGNIPGWLQLLIVFVIRDFVHFNIHRLLHRVNWMWEFHKVHHSVKEMGFAAQIRFHWAENIFYKVLEFIPLALLGISVTDFTILYIFTFFIGHFNHANITLPLSFFKYIFNNPEMHIWHHAKEMPNKYGVNFGLTLSIWDYLFKTNYIPNNGRDIELGFSGDIDFPKGFLGQFFWPVTKINNKIVRNNN